ncbi:hypothetical protein JJJ17_19810 [Paracoccus caeni]|uniref:Uncharacterized protein n=1 Tax=Paracoccus caeni TaxID=657651 RepID=A0A934SFZ5_9RHOB|nr:hypothetical protein [Paracoccus caeni]MBK4218180.1 hypothetical protein [Paracoccus caeni]
MSPFRLCLALLCGVSASAAAAQDFRTASQVDGLAIRPLSTLPANKAGAPDSEYCFSVNTEPKTPGGRAAAAANWAVTSEVQRDGLDFVTFAGKTTPGTSGSCLIEDGNLAIYRGETLLALIYATERTDRSIGSVEETVAGLRIWDGDWLSAPLADLRLYGDDLAILRNVASEDAFCGGANPVTTVYGLPIHLAREVLAADGWQPSIPKERPDGIPFFRDALIKAGLPEVQDCSGTGFGYCAFEYQSENGAILGVTTAGEGDEGSTPGVVGYSVNCP